MKEYYFIIAFYLLFSLILSSISYTKFQKVNAVCGVIITFLLMLGINFTANKYHLMTPDNQKYLGYIWVACSIYCFFIGSRISKVSSKAAAQAGKYLFKIPLQNGNIMRFTDPFDNFMILAGANGGKTKAIGKNLLSEYISNEFAGFIYDYKDFDYTKTAFHLIQKHNYKFPFYYISFTDMQRTYRFNPIKPSVINDENLLIQLMDDIFGANLGEGDKKDIWYGGALGVLRGVAIRFYRDFKQHCTVPHIMLFILNTTIENLSAFLRESPESRTLASGFLSSEGSEKTQASIMFSLTGYISTIAFNKNIMYVLSGDDFDFNLIDPANPKMISVANSYQIESLISPIMSLLVSVSSRAFTFANKVPFFYFLDEATTFKIRDFEKMPSVLREYLCSIVFITQSGAKIEKSYGKLDRSSILSNFSNLFLGRTKDIEALKTYGLLFSKKEEFRRTDTTRGSEAGSVSLSKVEKDRYDPSFFTNLVAGEFVGSVSHSNFKEFHQKFKFYVPDPSESNDLPIVKMVSESDVERNYREIIQYVSNL